MSDQGSDPEYHMGETVCVCQQVYEEGLFMIQCDICRDWLHGDCIKVDELEAADIDKYHCPRCAPMCGPSIYKTETNGHRHDKTDPYAIGKPRQVGTKDFVEELSKRIFPSSDDIIMMVSGKQLTLPYLNQCGFNSPILVTDKEGLSMTLPQLPFTVHHILHALGPDFQLDVIDVQRQKSVQMGLDQFVDTFTDPTSDRVLNCLSLEVSATVMAEVIAPPLVARKLCWVNNVWPSSNTINQTRPQVQKYIIMSMKDSYTDFHIDFGGTSVWYHVIEGEKIFYLIRPTNVNLSLFERWTRLSSQTETFLGDMVDKCYKLRIQAGQTIFIPTGWIHAVYTPKRSLVLGGNFLHSLNIQLQLRIYEIENRYKSPPKFRFPSFEVVNWLAAGKLKNDLSDLNSDNTPCPLNLLNGIRALVTTIRTWVAEPDKHDVIEELDCQTILKELNREVKIAERISMKVNPPKPERESKRQKHKKALDKDFIDISDPSSMYLLDWGQRLPAKGAGGSRKLTSNNKSLPVVARKSKPPEDLHENALEEVEAVEEELENNLNDHDLDDYGVRNNQTVAPIRLTLSRPESRANSPPRSSQASPVDNQKFDLTDRDSVRQLMTVNKKQAAAQLNSELNDALMDFGMTDNSDLVIDEAPKSKFRKKPMKSLKVRLSISSNPENFDMEETQRNNIYDPDPDNIGLGNRSTQEAIAGMLSMSTTSEKLHPKLAMKASLKKQSLAIARAADEKINRVHQDEDYIYPTLDMSDDEDYLPQQSTKDDQTWNPKIKVSHLQPKKDRPIRDGTKNIAIEKGLKNAAEKRAVSFLQLKKTGKIHKPKSSLYLKPINKSPLKKETLAPSTSNQIIPKKKGSAKQRLGKILKLKF